MATQWISDPSFPTSLVIFLLRSNTVPVAFAHLSVIYYLLVTSDQSSPCFLPHSPNVVIFQFLIKSIFSVYTNQVCLNENCCVSSHIMTVTFLTQLACEMSAIVLQFEHSLALPFFGIGMKADLFQPCGPNLLSY